MVPRYHFGVQSALIYSPLELWSLSTFGEPFEDGMADTEIGMFKTYTTGVGSGENVGEMRTYGNGEEWGWTLPVLISIGAAVLLSLTGCANQGAASQPGEPLSVTNAPGAGPVGVR
jgi:hypothetical protein